jgi:hypothetical protein
MRLPTGEKQRLLLISIAGVLFGIFLIIIGLQGLSYEKKADYYAIPFAYLALGFTIIVITIAHLIKTIKDLQKGIPVEDERSRRIFYKSAAMAFFVTIFLAIIENILPKDKTINIIVIKFLLDGTNRILIAFLIFGIFWLYYYYRGEPAEGGGW